MKSKPCNHFIYALAIVLLIPVTQLKAEITFHVEHLAKIDHEFSKRPASETVERLFFNQDPLHTKLISSNLPTDNLINYDHNSFAKGLMNAFAYHRPVSISPDIIWLLISQSFSNFVNSAPQDLQKLFVNHNGIKTLSVTMNKPMEELVEPDTWNEFFNEIQKQISSNTKNGIAELLVSDFSTTSPTETAVSQITLMNTVSSYFKYELRYAVCGIPEITLTGEPEDWQKIRSNTKELKGYGMDWWIKDLDPILMQFESASEGVIDTTFWQSMVKKKRPNEIRYASCQKGDQITEFDGWFLKFYPYDESGKKTPTKITYNYPLRPEMVSAPVTLVTYDMAGKTSTHTLEAIAGIIGLQEDGNKGQITPKVGWIIKENISDAQLLEKYETENRNGKPIIIETANRFPEFLKKFTHIHDLTIVFTSSIPAKPTWFDDIAIDKLRIEGPVYNKTLKDQLIEQFGSSVVIDDHTRPEFEELKTEPAF